MSNCAKTYDCFMMNCITTCFIGGALFFLIFAFVLAFRNDASPGIAILLTFLPMLFIVIGCCACYFFNKENFKWAFRTSEYPKEDTTCVVSAQQAGTFIHMSPQVPTGVIFLLH